MQNDSTGGPNPSGLCMCGCGGTTNLVTTTNTKRGVRKGQHRLFLKSHHLRGIPRSEQDRAKISTANKGRFTGEAHRRWKGGVQFRRGRKYLLVGEEHPMAKGSGGYVAEYRLVMAEKIGRMLETWEQVHHIDLDPTNNDPGNLALVTRSQHMRIHTLIRNGRSPDDALSEVLD